VAKASKAGIIMARYRLWFCQQTMPMETLVLN